MSGHSKWSRIKRQKAASDRKRGQLFSKLAKSIAVAAKNGGDPELNPALRLEIDRAREAGMPADTIERAIKRGTGEDKAALEIEEITYEAYGPNGVAILIQTATDNKNRTSSEVKHLLGKFGGSLGSPGSVSYLFQPKGQLLVSRENNHNLEDIQLLAIDLGAEDVQESEEGLEIYTAPTKLEEVTQGLEEKQVKIESAELAQVPQSFAKLTSEDAKQKVLELLEKLEEQEDVIAVYSNA